MSRASPRYPVRLAATVHAENARGSGDDMLICRTRNISREGCLLDTSHSIESGVHIEITIMDDQTGDAISMAGWAARSIDAEPWVGRCGVGVRIPSPPDAWLALVDRQAQRGPRRTLDFAGKRQSIVVVGDEDRHRGALALYVTSGWDVRFATDFAGAREALSSGEIDALVAEHDWDDERWPPLLELARELRPRARRLVRARLGGQRRPASGARAGLVHRVIDVADGLDALVDALTANLLSETEALAQPRRRVDPEPSPGTASTPSEATSFPALKAESPTARFRVLTDKPPLAGATAAALLREVLGRARGAASSGIIAFDLDATLLDNRPRQAAILRAYGRARGLPALDGCAPDDWRDWDVRPVMAKAGLSADAIRAHQEPYRVFWLDRFFTSEFCALDRPIPGAPDYVVAATRTGSRVLYVTGRPERMRDGTVESLGALGFPMPDGDRVHLVMKPRFEEGDDAYKARTHGRLRTLGAVVAAFDNEPTHINGYRCAFPEAICVHLATDHSPRPVRVAAGIPSIRDFSAFDPEPTDAPSAR